MKIYNRFTGKVIKEIKIGSLVGANLFEVDLSGANLFGANLSRADLSEANLFGANLSGADLFEAIGVIHFQFAGRDVWTQKEATKIGCQSFSNEKWLNMLEEEFVKNGAKPGHWEIYIKFIKLGMEILKNGN